MQRVLNILKKNPYLLAILGAVLLRLSFPKFNVWPLAFLGFVPFFFAWRQATLRQAIWVTFAAAWFFNIMLVFWLIHVTVAGMIVVAAYLALYFVLFAIAFRFAKERLSGGTQLIFLPAVWVLLEFLRSRMLTGFPWAFLGYSQSFNLPAIQIADIAGPYGVSFLLMFVNVFIFECLNAQGLKLSVLRRQIILLFCVIFLWFGYGFYRLNEDPQKSAPLTVSVVQGNIPQEIKWASSLKEDIFKKYRILTEIAVLRHEPDLVIWPETSFPDYFESESPDESLTVFARTLRAPLLVGSVRFDKSRYFNSAIFLSSKAKILGIYDKLHLVPFGEYIPARKLFPFLSAVVPITDFTPGEEYKIFSVDTKDQGPLKFGILICFEDIFSPLASCFVRRGADFLVNMTNDGWFGDTASPYQHLEASIFRAVENRVCVVRSANTGISCFIDDTGRILSAVCDIFGREAFITGSGCGVIHKTKRQSLYTKIGDFFVLVCLIVCMGVLVRCRRKKISG